MTTIPSTGLPVQGPGGDVPSRYERLAKIATGGMATVFVGRARGGAGFSRLVAIKCPHPFVSDDPVLRRGIEHEARIASMIHHPHVVSVLDVELRNDELALVLDYVDGGALSELQAHADDTATPLATGVAVRIILDVASGLHAAHVLCDPTGAPLGIVHRDVSPQNILVGLDGLARLTDFGIAKVAAEREHTATNVMKGKLGYLPPEYVEARAFDSRSDEYALAVVAWEALAGRRLFRGATELETLRQILDHAPRALSQVRPELAPLDGVFLRALAREPRLRFESVAAFAQALEENARRHLTVASSAEVAAVAEAAVGTRVRERLGAVAMRDGPSRGVASEPPPVSARDAVLTEALALAPLRVDDAMSADAPPTRGPGSRRALLVAMTGVTVLVILGIGYGMRQHVIPPAPAPASAPASASALAPASASALTSHSESAPAPAPAPASASAPRPLRYRPPPATVRTEVVAPAPSRAPPNPYAR